MISAPVIALYLGESYASLGVFDLAQKEIFEKSVFLPQVSLKNLLGQAKLKLSENLSSDAIPHFYIVTKYLDRLKNFRLGGSVTQVVALGFENSYSLINTKSLSLAAASLVISVTPENLNESLLQAELARIKKINPDTNKVVIQLSEKTFSPTQRELVHQFFSQAEFKVFVCAQPENLAEVRKTLLNAGTEGTKEEVVSDIKEIFGEETPIQFWCDQGFRSKFENHELFNSCNSFLASLAQDEKSSAIAYFDHECFRLIQNQAQRKWQSPWGLIPTSHYEAKDLFPHPYSEIRLDHLSMLGISNSPTQHEPGPVCAGRGIKPLVIDLFMEELGKIPMMQALFSQVTSETQKQKLENHLSVIEKGQADSLMKTNRAEMKKQIVENLRYEIKTASTQTAVKVTGPLTSLIVAKKDEFRWPSEILKKALG
jgi:hypothetical protein